MSVAVLMCLIAGQATSQPTDQELALIEKALPTRPVAEPKSSRRLLVFDRCDGFRHSSIPYWDKTLELMAKTTGAFEVQISSDMSVFTQEGLAGFDAICLNNTTRLTFNEQQRKALMDFVRSGKGLIGIHAATDNFYGWDEAAAMIGARFVKHPWTSDKTVSIKIEDPDHPLTRHWHGQGFKVNDEIYVTYPPFYDRSNLRVLMSLDMTDPQTRNVAGVGPDDLDTGISWVRSFGRGRVFYCSLGHNHHICWDPNTLLHYLAGIQFALGDLNVDTRPLPYPNNGRVKDLAELLEKASGYDFDKATSAIYLVEQTIRQLDEDPAYRLATEQLILVHLKAPGSLAWRSFLCKQLSNIGTERSVDELIQLMKDRQTADMAKYALERIGGPKARQGLLQIMTEVPVETQIGILSTFGNWRDRQVVGKIIPFMDASDQQLRLGAVAALARIGSEDAAAAILERMDRADQSFRPILADAALQAAQAMAADGLIQQAIGVYEKVYESDRQTYIKAAALSGWARIDKVNATSLILEALSSQDKGLAAAACGMVDLIPIPVGRAKALDMIWEVPEEGRISMLAAVARTKDRSLIPLVRVLAMSANVIVRMEAVKTLGAIGDWTCVDQLAQLAAATKGGTLQRVARRALVSLDGEGVDKQLIESLQTADPSVQCELIIAMAERSTPNASKALIPLASSADSQVRLEAQRALGQLAQADDLREMVWLLWADPTQAMEEAILLACRRLDAVQACTDLLTLIYDASGPQASKAAALRVIGKLGTDKGLSVLLDQLDSSDKATRTEAIRALAGWPDPRPMEWLWQIANQSKDQTERVLALRGYIGMVPMRQGSAQQKVGMLQKAMSIASRDDEKRLILSVLPDCACMEALAMAEDALGQGSLKAEAESAIVRLAVPLIRQQPDRVRALLQKVRAGTEDAFVRQRITQILRRGNID
ncbi:MAG: ThuA domain-containing protein [Sedimentisphaerales bacterium]|nr:ThuA domain-containing protein [Sedimentisphaerales bacterium]